MASSMRDFLLFPDSTEPQTKFYIAKCPACKWVSDYSYSEPNDHSDVCPVCACEGVEVICD